MVKKADIILFICIIFFSITLFISFFLIPKNSGNTLVVSVGSEELYRLNLNEDTEIFLPQNTIVIKDGQAFMKDADCNDKICINQGKIDEKGETVVCLPAGVILEVE